MNARCGIAMIPETITIAQAQELYGCHREAIMKAINSGDIDAYKPGKQYRIDKSSADNWFLSTKVKPIGRPRRGVKR